MGSGPPEERRQQVIERKQHGHEQAGGRADEHVPPDMRIVPSTGNEACPADEAVRRRASDVWFEAEIGQPQNRGVEQAGAYGLEQPVDLDADVGDMCRSEHPGHQARDEQDGGGAERPHAVAPLKLDVVPGEHCAGKHEAGHDEARQPFDGRVESGRRDRRRAGGVRPRAADREEHRAAVIGRCLDPEGQVRSIGGTALPRRALVGEDDRVPFRLHRA